MAWMRSNRAFQRLVEARGRRHPGGDPGPARSMGDCGNVEHRVRTGKARRGSREGATTDATALGRLLVRAGPGSDCPPWRFATLEAAHAQRAGDRRDRASSPCREPVETIPPTAGRPAANGRLPPRPRLKLPAGGGADRLRSGTGPREGSPVRDTVAPPAPRAAEFADGAGAATAPHSCRAGSPPAATRDEPHSASLLPPRPLATGHRAVDVFDERRSRPGASPKGPLGLDAESDAAPLDDDGLAALRGVKELGEALTSLTGCIPSHACTLYIVRSRPGRHGLADLPAACARHPCR